MERKLNPNCPCTSACPRHGDCEKCKEYHKSSLTVCQRLQKKKAEKAK